MIILCIANAENNHKTNVCSSIADVSYLSSVSTSSDWAILVHLNRMLSWLNEPTSHLHLSSIVEPSLWCHPLHTGNYTRRGFRSWVLHHELLLLSTVTVYAAR